VQARRAAATAEDVRKAMQESVIPADTKLFRALENGRRGKSDKLIPFVANPPLRTSEDSLMMV